MKIYIEIECYENEEVFTHLSVIRSQIKKALKENENFNGVLEDSNCYGWHTIEIEEEIF